MYNLLINQFEFCIIIIYVDESELNVVHIREYGFIQCLKQMTFGDQKCFLVYFTLFVP